jgi:HEAT repeat protein
MSGLIDPDEVGRVVHHLDRLDPAELRHQALQSLRRVNTLLKPSEAEVAVYIQDLHDPDAAVRLGAVKSLSRTGPALAPALQALDEAARDPDPDVRRLATDLLRQAQPR